MIKNIQALRGIAVMFVLLAHLTVIEKKYFSGIQLLPEFLAAGISGVDIFFVISGFIIVSVTQGWHEKPTLVPRFLYNRVSRIFPMYWIYSFIVLMVFIIRPSMVNNAQGSNIQLIESFLLLPLPQGTYPLLGVGWSLIHEMYFYLVFSVLLFFPERFIPRILILWAIAVPLFFVFQGDDTSSTIQLISHPLTYEFIAGCAIGFISRNSKFRAPYFALWLALSWWITAYTIFSLNIGWGMAPVDWRRLLVFGIPAALLCYGVIILERDHAKHLPKWMHSIGDSSYSIYLSHLLVISALGRVWGALNVENALLNLAALVSIFLCALAIGKLSYRFVELPIHRWTRTTVQVVQ